MLSARLACKNPYIFGKTNDLFREHKDYAINQKKNKTTGEHFSQIGHQVSDKRVTILEKVFCSDPAIRKERERYFIVQMNTKHKGLNKIP